MGSETSRVETLVLIFKTLLNSELRLQKRNALILLIDIGNNLVYLLIQVCEHSAMLSLVSGDVIQVSPEIHVFDFSGYQGLEMCSNALNKATQKHGE